jgi:ribosomal-protein-alanine N-acetyltransferase
VNVPDDIVGGRLILRLLSPDALHAASQSDLARLAELTGFNASEEWGEIARIAKRRLAQVGADPGYLPWSVRAVALRSSGEIVGYINFHAAPGSDDLKAYAPSAVELGYAIIARHRGHGYAGEAVRMMMTWAGGRGADAFVFSISPSNVASLALAARLGAKKVGSRMDEEDGLEDVYLLRPKLTLPSRPG